MAQPATEHQMIDGPLNREFARFVLPSVAGMLAVSTAGIVDGIFVGKFVGPTALASVNIAIPMLSLVFGILIMLTVGSAVIAGKHLGERRFRRASDVFTKSLIVVLVILSALSALVLVFPEELATLLGAQGETLTLSAQYLSTIAWFLPLLGLEILASQFVRVDGRPGFALSGMIIVAVINIALDALFIGYFGWGVQGAALATGLAYLSGALFLVTHFFTARSKLKITRPIGSWSVMWRAAFNGFSEFLNEASGGLVMLLFNWILMTQIGASGVAAFTVVNYLLFIGILTFYGVSEGLTPLISVNFGAGRQDRIVGFLTRGIGLNLVVGVVLALTLLLGSEHLVGLFLDADETETIALAQSIIVIIWPAFLFSGISLTLSGYFTGLHCARQSAIIALSRSLLLPVGLIGLFWFLFGYMGAFFAVPVSEAMTLILAIFLFRRQRRKSAAALAKAGA